MRDIVVGDVHGCFPELIELLKKVQFDERYDRLILLGDVIDRGNYSYEVFVYLRNLKTRIGDRLVLLKGNHEDMYLRTAGGDTEIERVWGFNGRASTARSFFQHRKNIMDPNIVDWFERHFQLSFSCPSYQCVHAGLVYEDLEKNTEHDLIWDRTSTEGFAYSGKLTIVGHTPVEQASWTFRGSNDELVYGEWFDLPDAGIIELDTGCVFKYKLTAMIIEGMRAKLESVFYGKDMPELSVFDEPMICRIRDHEKSSEAIAEERKDERKARKKSRFSRSSLQKDDQIKLYREEGGAPGIWTIYSDTPQQGGSCMVYRAEYNGVRGVLKEFYPMDLVERGALSRNNNKKIVSRADMRQEFSRQAERYEASYMLLQEKKAEDSDLELLNNYIPAWEILWDSRSKDRSRRNLYVWMPHNPKGEVFENILKRWRTDIDTIDPYVRVANILETMISMTKCIEIFHHNGFIHRDIKPANFLVVYDQKNHLDHTKTLLFDIDTIYHTDQGSPSMVGSPGFMDPELRNERVEMSTRSDVYSLGATLYYALYTEKGQGIYYHPWESKSRRLGDTVLFQQMEEDSRKIILEKFEHIFSETLNECAENRYSSCGDPENVCGALLLDLEDALNTVRSCIRNTEKETSGDLRWLSENTEPMVSPKAVIQDLLYRYPIYQLATDDQTVFRVLTIGKDSYCHEFIDAVLQAMQVYGCRIHVVAASEDAEENCKEYLSHRPMLSQFVRVDLEDEICSQFPSETQSYGRVSFINLDDGRGHCGFDLEEIAYNRRIAQYLVNKCLEQDEIFSCIFVSLEEFGLNAKVASIFHQLMNDPKNAADSGKCSIHYLQRACGASVNEEERLHSVDLQRGTKPKDISPELLQRALKCHVIWNQGMDGYRLKETFLDVEHNFYNYQASLAYALSIGYKLWSIGLDVSEPKETVKQFQQLLKIMDSDPNPWDEDQMEEHRLANLYIRRLTALEHRRWVLDKVCQGYTAFTEDENHTLGVISAELCSNKTIDAEHGKHMCICFSDERLPIIDAEKRMKKFKNTDRYEQYREKYFALWDEIPLDDVRQMTDDLDYLSIKLHRELVNFDYLSVYGNTRPWEIEFKKINHSLMQMSVDADEIKMHVREMEDTLSQIINRIQPYDRRFLATSLKRQFRDLEQDLNRLPDKWSLQRIYLTRSLKELERIIYPITEGNRYVDYKSYDYELICGLVDILS